MPRRSANELDDLIQRLTPKARRGARPRFNVVPPSARRATKRTLPAGRHFNQIKLRTICDNLEDLIAVSLCAFCAQHLMCPLKEQRNTFTLFHCACSGTKRLTTASELAELQRALPANSGMDEVRKRLDGLSSGSP